MVEYRDIWSSIHHQCCQYFAPIFLFAEGLEHTEIVNMILHEYDEIYVFKPSFANIV